MLGLSVFPLILAILQVFFPSSKGTVSESNLNSTSLKSSLNSCTFSIGLYENVNGNGWNGNYASLFVNSNPIFPYLTLDSGYGPVWYDFDVTENNPISVTYNPTGTNQYADTYVIKAGPLGSGANVYSSLPFFKNLTNSCSSTCTYTVNYYFNGNYQGPNSISVYINRLATVYQVSLSPTEFQKSFNFVASKNDLIQIPFYFDYAGGSSNNLGYGYTVSLGGVVVYIFQPSLTGPSTPANIVNYCTSNLFLTVSIPKLTNPWTSETIQVAVVPSIIPSSPIQTTLSLYCGSNVSSQNRLTSANNLDTFNFIIPNNFVGPCYFIATSLDLSAPHYSNSESVSILIPYPTVFTSPTTSGSVYGSAIPVIVSTTYPVPQNLTISFSCANPVILEYFNVTTGIETLYSPSSKAIGTCSFAVSSYPSELSPSSITFPINGTFSFVTPPSSPIQYISAGSSTPIALKYYPSGPTTFDTTTITLTCSQSLNSTSSYSLLNPSFKVPFNFYGSSCNFTAFTPSYSLNNSVAVVITQLLTFAQPPNGTEILIPKPISIKTITNPDIVSQSIALNLTCGTSWNSFNVTTNVATNYALYSSNSYGPCSLSVASAPVYLISKSSASFNLKYDAVITAPATIYIGQDFNVTITPTTPAIPTTSSLGLFCGGNQVQIWTSVPVGSQQTLKSSDKLNPSSSCNLKISNDPYFSSSFSSSISLKAVSVQFNTPAPGSTYLIPQSIPVLVSAVGNPSLSLQLNVSPDNF